jgi:hypothetical protein
LVSRSSGIRVLSLMMQSTQLHFTVQVNIWIRGLS